MPYYLHNDYITSITGLDERKRQYFIKYRNDNQEEYNQYQKNHRDSKVKCECGTYTNDINKHIRSAIHFKNIMRSN